MELPPRKHVLLLSYAYFIVEVLQAFEKRKHTNRQEAVQKLAIEVKVWNVKERHLTFRL